MSAPTPQQGEVAAELAALRPVRADHPVRDGSGLEHEKRLLNLVIGTIPQVVWWKGPDLRYTGCNAAYLRLRGLTDTVELVGRLEEQVTTADGIGEHLGELERSVLDSGRAVVDARFGVGEPRRAFQFGVVPYLDGGVIAGVVGVGADVSHVTELERQLTQVNRLEAIGQLAAGIAHEINTPVQYACDNTRFVADAVSSVFEGLRELRGLLATPAPDGELRVRLQELLDGVDLDFLTEEVPSALTQSLEGLDRVTQIVRAMKDFSHPGQGRSQADLNRLITSTVQVSRNEWRYVAEVDLDLDPAVGEVPCFEGDLKQAVLNVVVNAAHAIDERRRQEGRDRPGRIVVASSRVGDEVAISITDDGTGMDECTRQRVFDPFFTTKEVGKGTGQGLTLARGAMEKHGGRIEVVSTLGRGTTFTLLLPVTADGAGDDPGAPGHREGQAAGVAADIEDRRVLR